MTLAQVALQDIKKINQGFIVCLFVCLGRGHARTHSQEYCSYPHNNLWPLYWQYWTFLMHFCPELGLPRFSLPPLQLLLMDILTAYQRPSRLETPLQALMPTPVQLSTVGQPLLQGNHKLHVIEVPFRLGLGCISHPYIQWCILIICSCIYMFIYRGYIHAT